MKEFAAVNELLTRLTIAQLTHVHEMTKPNVQYEGIDSAMHSDDSYDYLKAALALGRELLEMQYDNDLANFAKLFDPKAPEFIPQNYASDGICAAVWEYIPEDWYDLAPEDPMPASDDDKTRMGLLWKSSTTNEDELD